MDNDFRLQKVESLISDYSLNELIALNHIIVERIKHLQKAHSLSEMVKFKTGEIVSFEHAGQFITGKIVKFNQKTVTIITNDNHRWNVPPRMLMRKVY